jgi:adenylate cyclase
LEIRRKYVFDHLWISTEGRRISKERLHLQHEGIVIDIDVYSGSLNGLIVAEIEFRSQEDALSYTPLSWMNHDITNDDAYENRSLAVNGLPN